MDARVPDLARRLLRNLRSDLHRLYRAGHREKRAARDDHACVLRLHRDRGLHRGHVRGAVRRHLLPRLAARPLRPPRGVHDIAAVVFGRLRDHGVSDHAGNADPVALRHGHRRRRRDHHDRQLCDRNRPAAHARPRDGVQPDGDVRRGAGRRDPVVLARADDRIRARRLAHRRARRVRRRGAGVVHPARGAGKPALARVARASRAGRRDRARHRSDRRAAGGRAVAGAAADRRAAAASARVVRGAAAAAVSVALRAARRVQSVSGDRLLRLRELGADAADRAGHHRDEEPAVFVRHRVRAAGRAAARDAVCGPRSAQMADRRRRAGGDRGRHRVRVRALGRAADRARRADQSRRPDDLRVLPRVSGRTVSDRDPLPRERARLFGKPYRRDDVGLHHRRAAAGFRRGRRVRRDYRMHAGGRAVDRDFRAAHERQAARGAVSLKARAYGRRMYAASGKGRAASGQRRAARGEQRAASGERRAARGEQRATSSKQQAASSKQQAASSKRRSARQPQPAANEKKAVRCARPEFNGGDRRFDSGRRELRRRRAAPSQEAAA
ncbi:Major facilitator superfamily (MFS_1) transporter [Burkholderia dolosa AU0158]|nr:Major facilitator superfamily (MFS_1) transporter [Burkholderia dolosa AU0158]